MERPSAAGKASSVQFIHFPFTDAQVATFRQGGAEIVAGFTHPEYAHMRSCPSPCASGPAWLPLDRPTIIK